MGGIIKPGPFPFFSGKPGPIGFPRTGNGGGFFPRKTGPEPFSWKSRGPVPVSRAKIIGRFPSGQDTPTAFSVPNHFGKPRALIVPVASPGLSQFDDPTWRHAVLHRPHDAAFWRERSRTEPQVLRPATSVGGRFSTYRRTRNGNSEWLQRNFQASEVPK